MFRDNLTWVLLSRRGQSDDSEREDGALTHQIALLTVKKQQSPETAKGERAREGQAEGAA